MDSNHQFFISILKLNIFHSICPAVIIAEKRARIQKELNEIDELYTKKEGHDENVEDESNDDGAIESRESLRANQAPEEHPILNEKDVQNEEMEEEKGDTVNETTEFEPIYDE